MPVDNENSNENQDGDKDPKWYRETIARKDQELETAQAQIKSLRFEQLGVDTTKGLGKTMFETFQGVPEDVDSLREWAADKFEWAPKAPEATTDATQQQNVQNRQEASTHDRIDEVTTDGGNRPDKSDTADLDKKIAEAEEGGDMQTAIALKVQRARQTSG